MGVLALDPSGLPSLACVAHWLHPTGSLTVRGSVDATPAGQPRGPQEGEGGESGAWTLTSGNKTLSMARNPQKQTVPHPAFAEWASAGSLPSSVPSAQTTCPFPAHFATLYLCLMSSFWASVPFVCFDHLMTPP